MHIFMRAAKRKLRFTSDKGTLSTECLWDLGLDDLNALVVRLRDEAKETEADGYLDELSEAKVDTAVKLRFEVAEAIIKARVAEVKERNKTAENKIERDSLMAVIARLEAKELEETDIETLKARVVKLS